MLDFFEVNAVSVCFQVLLSHLLRVLGSQGTAVVLQFYIKTHLLPLIYLCAMIHVYVPKVFYYKEEAAPAEKDKKSE